MTVPQIRFTLAISLVTTITPLRAQDRAVEVTLTEGTNIAAALSPDGRTLAIDLLGRIWTLPSVGGPARALTDEYGDARQPAWSPDGRRIAFQSYRDGTWHIWSVAADGSDLTQHTHGEFDHREPVWSLDGRSLVFSSDRTGNYDIWRLDLTTHRFEQLTEHPGNDFGPAVAPDGASIAFVSNRPGGNGVWIRDGEGSEVLWAAVPGQVSGPSFSPDGRTIAFNALDQTGSALAIAERGATPRRLTPPAEDVFPFRAAWLSDTEVLYTGDGGIRRMRLTGEQLGSVGFTAPVSFVRRGYRRAPREFDAITPEPVRGIVAPAVSPDGSQVVLTALGDLWLLMNGQMEQLTKDAFVQNDPMWSPDGRRIVFASDRSGFQELWLRDMTTGQISQLTHDVGGAALPSWSPDGTRIVFQVQVGLGTSIHMIELASGRMTEIRSDLFMPSRAAWGPNGHTIAFAALKPNSSRFREGRNEVLVMSLDGAPERWFGPMIDRGIGTRGIDGPAWSPDGRNMAFVVDGLLWSLPISQDGSPVGPPVRLSDELAGSITWTGDSRFIVYQVNDGLRRVSVSDGATEAMTVPLTWRRRQPTAHYTVHAGRLWDGLKAEVDRDVDVVIEGHRIVRVVRHDAGLHRDSVVDASRYTVMPGLADAHAHIGYGAGEVLGRIWLAYGITIVRDPAADAFAMRERREAVESGVRVGPREIATGRIFDGSRIYYGFNNGMTAGSQLLAELQRAADLRFGLIKTYVRLPDVLQKRIIDFAHDHGMPVSSHELYPAVAFGADHVEHLRGTSRRGYSPKISNRSRSYQDVVELLTASGMSITPTIGIQGGFADLTGREPAILDDPRLEAVYGRAYADGLRRRAAGGAGRGPNPQVIAQGETVRRVLAGGGRVIAGTDAPIVPYGLSLHTELQNYVEGGLTPVEALKTATSMFADAVGLSDHLGSISAGRLADITIVEGNPLERIGDTRRVRIVIKNGEVFTLERLLAGVVERN